MNQIQFVTLVLIIVTVIFGYTYFDNHRIKQEYSSLSNKYTASESLKAGIVHKDINNFIFNVLNILFSLDFESKVARLEKTIKELHNSLTESQKSLEENQKTFRRKESDLSGKSFYY